MSFDGLSHERVRALLDIIHDVYTDPTSLECWKSIYSHIRNVIPSDSGAIAFMRDDGEFDSGESFGADLPGREEYAEYYKDLDPVTPLAISRNIHVFRPEDMLTRAEYHATEYYNDFIVGLGFPTEHVIAVLGLDHQWGAHVVAGRDKPFTDDEVRFLELLQPHFNKAFRDAKLRSDMQQIREALARGIDLIPVGVLFFDSKGHLVHMSKHAKAVCDAFGDDEQGALESARSCAADLITGCRKGRSDRPQATTELRQGRSLYRLTGFPIELPDSSLYCMVMAVDAVQHVRQALHRLAASGKLSARESEVCLLLLRGMSNKAIAEALSISLFTVKDHIKSILAKLEAGNRGEIAAKLLGF